MVGPASALQWKHALWTGGATSIFLFFLIVTPPHFVHHLFDSGQGSSCQVLQVVSHADCVPVVDLNAVVLPDESSSSLSRPLALTPIDELWAFLSRAPPA